MQALQPWRRVFRDAFAHDRASGSPRSATDCVDSARPVATALWKRCGDVIPDLESMLPLLCTGLDLPAWSVPVAPPPTTGPPQDLQVR